MMDPLMEYAKAALTGLLANPNRPSSQGWIQAVCEDAWKIAEEMDRQSDEIPDEEE